MIYEDSLEAFFAHWQGLQRRGEVSTLTRDEVWLLREFARWVDGRQSVSPGAAAAGGDVVRPKSGDAKIVPDVVVINGWEFVKIVPASCEVGHGKS